MITKYKGRRGILKGLEVKESNHRKPINRPISIIQVESDISEFNLRNEEYVYNYKLIATVGAIFQCRRSDLEFAKDSAEVKVLSELHSGYLKYKHDLLNAIYGHDTEEAIRIMAAIEMELIGEDN